MLGCTPPQLRCHTSATPWRLCPATSVNLPRRFARPTCVHMCVCAHVCIDGKSKPQTLEPQATLAFERLRHKRLPVDLCTRMRTCVRACVRACVRVCVRSCIRACAHAGVPRLQIQRSPAVHGSHLQPHSTCKHSVTATTVTGRCHQVRLSAVQLHTGG